jgi:hypothetical protein
MRVRCRTWLSAAAPGRFCGRNPDFKARSCELLCSEEDFKKLDQIISAVKVCYRSFTTSPVSRSPRLVPVLLFLDRCSPSASTWPTATASTSSSSSGQPRISPVLLTSLFFRLNSKVRKAYPKHTIMAGNVVTGEMVEELILSGADIVKASFHS